jgi:hypothetical protein
MQRRHLFDFGFPVATGTRLAGSYVLLAVARHAQRLSDERISRSLVAIATTEHRLLLSRIARGYTRRLTHGQPAQPHRPVEARGEVEPGKHAPGETTHPA